MSATRSFTAAEAQHYAMGVVPEATVWRYVLPFNQRSDGGTFLLDSSGMFSAVSAYGGYAYRWSAFGTDFRSFFARCDADYLYGKLHQRPRGLRGTINGDATARAIRKRAWEDFGAGAAFDYEVELLASWGDLDESLSWEGWLGETKLVEPWFLSVPSIEDPECRAFCTRLVPRLQARLRLDVQRGRP